MKPSPDLQTELDSSSQETAKRQQLELQVDTASKEVQHLQGQLADLNAVLSNHVSSTKLESLHDQHAKLLASNHAERQRVDAIYSNRAAKQRQTKEVQATAEQIQKQLEQKVHEMTIEQQQEYYNLQVADTMTGLIRPSCSTEELIDTALILSVTPVRHRYLLCARLVHMHHSMSGIIMESKTDCSMLAIKAKQHSNLVPTCSQWPHKQIHMIVRVQRLAVLIPHNDRISIASVHAGYTAAVASHPAGIGG